MSIPSFAIAHMCTSMSAGDLWRQELRWGRTIKSIDRWGYAASALGYPLPLALIAAVMSSTSIAVLAPAIGIAIIAIAWRMVLLWQVERAFRLPRQSYWLVPVRDLLSFGVFALSFLGRQVNWRGRRYRTGYGGDWVVDRGAHSQ